MLRSRITSPIAAIFQAEQPRAPGSAGRAAPLLVERLGHVVNIGASGIFIGTESPPARGASVRVVFENALGGKVEVDGVVCWNTAEAPFEAPGFGMEIGWPSDAYLELYEGMVRALGQKPTVDPPAE